MYQDLSTYKEFRLSLIIAFGVMNGILWAGTVVFFVHEWWPA